MLSDGPKKAKQAHFRDLLLRIRHLYGWEYHSGHYTQKYIARYEMKIRAIFRDWLISKAPLIRIKINVSSRILVQFHHNVIFFKKSK